MKFILGKKIGMSQIFVGSNNERKVVPVTLIEVGPCVVTQVRTKEKDGYVAVQLGYDKKKKINKPLSGHLKEMGKFRYIKEFRLNGYDEKYNPGDKLDAAIFANGDKIKVVGTSKSKGFQGPVKRHGFRGGPATHGQKHSHREPGSIGTRFPQHVLRGKRMAGRMGGDKVTQRGLEVVEVDKNNNLLLVKGAVPGRIGALVKILSE